MQIPEASFYQRKICKQTLRLRLCSSECMAREYKLPYCRDMHFLASFPEPHKFGLLLSSYV